MTINAPLARPDLVAGSPDRVKTAIAAAIGTCVENYDFIAYGTASALYFGAAFFPKENAAIGTLLAFATLAVGFVMRPLGGAIGGYLADRVGRKPILVAAMLVMGIATVLIGALPTYDQIGVIAPVLLIVVRIVQGLAFGAEWGSAVTMTYEHAPWRRRGFFASIPQSGNYVGIALASLMFVLSAHLPGDWAWRVPFLLSAVLIAAGIIVRLRLTESPEFVEKVLPSLPVLKSIADLPEFKQNAQNVKIIKEWQPVAKTYASRGTQLTPLLASIDGGQPLNTFTQTMLTGQSDSKTALAALETAIKALQK